MTGLQRAEKERIAARALTLQERLAGNDAGPRVDNQADEVLETWREYVANGDDKRFRERVDREKLALDECRRRLARSGWPSNEALPDWVDELDRMVEHARSSRPAAATPEPDSEIPFVHVLWPLVSYATDSLPESTASVASESAIREFGEWLAEDLGSIFSHTLFIEFKSYVEINFETTDAVPADGTDTGRYEAFVSHAIENLDELFLEYSFLARIAVTTVEQWRSVVEDVCDRVADDRTVIRELVAGAEDPLRLVGVAALGDPHVGGRRVLKLEFDGGGSVAYKPRRAGIAAGFNELLRWLDENSRLPDLEAARTVCRDGYSWMEWVEPRACSTRQGVSEYYRRAGMLICLFYATDTVDMHLGNVVARGSHPVVVDLETLAHPEIDDEYRITDREQDARDTVLRTGAVPEGETSEELLDISCFSTSTVTFSSGTHGFEDVNTDGMELTEGNEVVVDGDNLPRHDGEDVDPGGYVAAIVDGFRETYEFVLDHRDEILAEDGPVSRLRHGEARVSVLYRNSRNYSAIRELLTHQPNLRTGLQFGAKVESLAKPILTGSVDEDSWQVYRYERETLRNWNCPRFTGRPDERNLYHRDRLVVTDFFRREPIQQVRQRIRGFSRADLERQAKLVRDGFTT